MRLILSLGLLLTMQASAGLLTIQTIIGSGPYSHDTNLIKDGTIPGEGSAWNAVDKVYWSGYATSFRLDLGSVFLIQDLLTSLDNNDTYLFEISTDGTNYSTLTNILSSYGDVGFGMDTFSTVSGDPEYVANVDFNAVQGRYVRVTGTSGDNSLSVGEVQLYGEAVSTVPEPSTIGLMGGGLGLLALRRRK